MLTGVASVLPEAVTVGELTWAWVGVLAEATCGCRRPRQQPSRDHAAAAPSPSKHRGAEGGGRGEPPGEVSRVSGALPSPRQRAPAGRG